MRTLLSILLLFICFSSAAGEEDRIKSLQKSITATKNEKKKIKLYVELGELYSLTSSDSLYPLAGKLLLLCKKNQDHCGEATAHFFKGNYFYRISDVSEALNEYKTVLNIRKKHCSKESIASIQMQLGNVQNMAGDHATAVEHYFKSLAYYEKVGDYKEVSKIHLNLGSSEESRNNYKKAEKHYRKSISLFPKTKDSLTLGNANNNLGGLYQAQEKPEEALIYFQKAMDIYKALDHRSGLAHGYNNIGIIYYYAEEFDSCLMFFEKALNIRKKIGDRRSISQSYNNIGSFYHYQEKYNYAVMYSDSALMIATKAGVKEEMSEAHYTLHEIYFSRGEYKKSIEQLQKYSDYQSELFSEQNERIIREKDTKYESVKREQELQAKNKDLVIKENAIQRQNIIIWSAVIGAILLALLLISVIRRNRTVKAQKEIIEKQKSTVDKKQNEIINSIKYAKRIQEALLKSDHDASNRVPEHFILFKPKDIVSGDFYWVKEKDNFLYIAVADCTGHGVPGAFLTMLGSSFLNEIFANNNDSNPSIILDKLRMKFVKELSQSAMIGENKDGMDISLARLNLTTKKLTWSGANNPLWILRASSEEIDIVKPHKQPIAFARTMTPFENHTIQLNAGDAFYLFSDGYADQFGGPKGKKFMAKSFRRLIVEVRSNSMQKQREIIEKSFEDWKSGTEQIDDVCVIGMKIDE